jgi:hypothetical protein
LDGESVLLKILAVALWPCLASANAQMVNHDSLGQSLSEELACATTVKNGSYPVYSKVGSYRISGPLWLAFKVGAQLADEARRDGAILIALNNDDTAWLVECQFSSNQSAKVVAIYPDKEVLRNGSTFSRWSLFTKDEMATASIDIEKLTLEKQHLTRVLKSIDLMLNTGPFISRAGIYCRSQVNAFPVLPSIGTVEDLEIDYAAFTQQQSRPDPTLLQIWTERLIAARNNMNVCQQAIINGYQPLPTAQQQNDEAAKARARIAEIDRLLTSRK